MQGAGRVVFAAIMLLILGVLNVIYGIGALDNANVYTDNVRLVFDDLNTYGWLLIILGAIQLIGGFSLMAGNTFGRIIGIIGGSIGAIFALISMFIFFAATWFGFFLARGIAVPIRRMAEATELVAAGDLDADLLLVHHGVKEGMMDPREGAA